MRRTLATLALGAALLLVLPLLPAQAATGLSQRFSEKGVGAEGAWSTFPASGNPTPGVVYVDTYINAVRQATLLNGTRLSGNVLFVDEFRYEFNSRGRPIFVSDTSGTAHGSRVTLSVDNQLGSSSATATVRLRVCTATGCTHGGTATVSASWTADGPKVLVNGTSLVHTKGFTDIQHQHGFTRDATARATVSDVTRLGPLQFADIFNMRSSDVCVGTC